MVSVARVLKEVVSDHWSPTSLFAQVLPVADADSILAHHVCHSQESIHQVRKLAGVRILSGAE